MPSIAPTVRTSKFQAVFQTVAQPVFMYVTIFTIAVVAALVQNFCVPNTRTALIYDSESYLLTTTWVGVFLSSLLHLHPKLSFVTAPLNYSEILLDGPGFPLINALIFLPFHHVPAPFEWKWLLIVQSFWLGVSSCLCSYLAAKITKSRLCLCAAGLIWTFYPGALISTQRYLTEPLAATLLLGCACLLCCHSIVPKRSVLAGLLAGLLTLTKAALLPVSFALAAVTAMFVVRKRIFIFLFFLGVVCMLAPWALYTKMVGGKMFFIPQRYTSYNFTLGYDLESDGWCTIPHSPYQKLFENSDADFTTTLAQWQQHPAQCMQLTLRKFSRLYAQPWNDFRHSALGLGPEFQCRYHTTLLCLTALAMLLFISMRRTAAYASVDERLGLWLCMTAFLGHLIYLPFESLNRYSFTGMPYACILSVYSIWALLQQSKTDKSQLAFLKIAAIAVAAGLIVFWVQNVEAFSHESSVKEVQIELNPGQSISSYLDLSSLKLPDHFDAYILIDGDHNVCNTRLRFNGHVISDPVRPSFYFDSSRYALSDPLERFSTERNTGVYGFRQWVMAAIPSAWVDRKANTIDLIAGPGGCLVYGDSRATRNLPDLNSFVPDNIANYFNHYDPRTTNPCFTAASKSKSWLELSSAQTKSAKPLACVPRLKLLLAIPSITSSISSGKAPATVCNTTQTSACINNCGRILLNRNLVPSQFVSALTRDAGPGLLRVNSNSIQPSYTTGIRIPLPKIFNSEHLHIQLTGTAHKNSNNGIFGIEVAFRGDDAIGMPLVLANIPRFESAGSSWNPFTIDNVVPVASIASGKRFLEITFFPGPWMDISTHGRNNNSSDVSIKDLHLRVSTCYFPDIAGKRIIIY